MKPKYQDVTELANAINNLEVDPDKIHTFNCKKELFIKGENGEELFTAYYGTNNACDDICALLGLPEPEHV